MVAKLKVLEKSDIVDLVLVNDKYYSQYKVEPLDLMLVESSPCGDYEYLYLFMDTMELNYFLYLLSERGIEVYENVDFTDNFKTIVKNNNLDYFKSKLSDLYTFNDLIVKFYNDVMTVDDVLDKMIDLGKDSLNNYDKKLLGIQ